MCGAGGAIHVILAMPEKSEMVENSLMLYLHNGVIFAHRLSRNMSDILWQISEFAFKGLN